MPPCPFSNGWVQVMKLAASFTRAHHKEVIVRPVALWSEDSASAHYLVRKVRPGA